MSKIYQHADKEVSVAAGAKIAAYSEGDSFKIYTKSTFTNHPESWSLLATVEAGERYTSAAFSVATDIRIEAGADDVEYSAAENAVLLQDIPVTRSTITPSRFMISTVMST